MTTTGDRIRRARLFRGLTAEELASMVGYATQSGIANLENRATGRGGYRLPRIAQALDVSLDWLLGGPDTIDISDVPGYFHLIDEEKPPLKVSSLPAPPYLPQEYAWPFRQITPQQWNSLSQDVRKTLEQQISGLLAHR